MTIRNRWNKSQVKLILDQINRIGAIMIKCLCNTSRCSEGGWLSCPRGRWSAPTNTAQCHTRGLSAAHQLLWKTRLGSSKLKLNKELNKCSIIWHINKGVFLIFILKYQDQYVLSNHEHKGDVCSEIMGFGTEFLPGFELGGSRKDALGPAQHRTMTGKYSGALGNWCFVYMLKKVLATGPDVDRDSRCIKETHIGRKWKRHL